MNHKFPRFLSLAGLVLGSFALVAGAITGVSQIEQASHALRSASAGEVIRVVFASLSVPLLPAFAFFAGSAIVWLLADVAAARLAIERPEVEGIEPVRGLPLSTALTLCAVMLVVVLGAMLYVASQH